MLTYVSVLLIVESLRYTHTYTQNHIISSIRMLAWRFVPRPVALREDTVVGEYEDDEDDDEDKNENRGDDDG